MRLIGLQLKPVEGGGVQRPLRTHVDGVRDYFKTKFPSRDVIGSDRALHLLTILLFEGFDDILTSNFQSIVEKLGYSVAGDEKLFHFTGEDGDLRLVISKPDRIGHWWYELCASLSKGSNFLLFTKMHTNRYGVSISVDSIVERWKAAILSIGSGLVPVGSNPNPSTLLVFDSYYMSKGSRDCLERKGPQVAFSASCRPDNFRPERMLLTNEAADQPGDEQSIYNETSSELFTYHYDRQKGVGKKYNLSSGFIRSTRTDMIRKYKDIIPGYSHYKVLFEPCDRFNRNLHQRHWPYKRGGRNIRGAAGSQHDFLMACILQNTFNAYDEISCGSGDSLNFKDMCCELAADIFTYSLSA